MSDKSKAKKSKKQTKAKKQMPKKKKIAIIVVSVLAALLIAVIVAGSLVLKWYCTPADYEIVTNDNKHVTLVAHRGFRGVAPENTEPAFLCAGTNAFWGAECDTYRTKDGVWVIEHDPVTYRMHGGVKFIEKMTYDQLTKMPITNGVNIENYPDLEICTLEKYLQICAAFRMTPVIELKGKNNTEHYDEIIELVNKYQLEAIYISFEFEDLKAMRELTDAKLYYLVKAIKEDDIELVKTIDNCGIDFDGNNEKNFKSDIIVKCHGADVELGAWTIDDPEVADKLIKSGVTLITTNAIKPAA